MTYLELDYELCRQRRRQRRQRSRMERLRRRLNRWKAAAILLGLALLLALLQPLWRIEAEATEIPVAPDVPVIEALPTAIVAEPQPPAASQPHYSRIMEAATVTHYCICEKCCGKAPDHPAYGITASGRAAEPYVSIAVDPYLIELGSTVYLDFGDGELLEVRADDTGSGISGTHIDLCVSDHEEALQLGVRTATVYVEEEPHDKS